MWEERKENDDYKAQTNMKMDHHEQMMARVQRPIFGLEGWEEIW